MPEIVHVTEVRTVGDHLLWLRFEDGAEGKLDFSSQSWHGIFERLATPEYFAKVELDEELGTLVWPNGADIAPESLHRWVIDGGGTVPA